MRLFWYILLFCSLCTQAYGQVFEIAGNYPVGEGPIRLVTADFNNDGRLDIASCNYNDATLSVLIGLKGGKFAAAITENLFQKPADFKAIDLDRDGNIDLAITGEQEVEFWKGQGNGTFRYHNAVSTISAYAALTGDFNKDGWEDIAATNIFQDNISVLYGSQNGISSSRQDFAAGDQPSYLEKGDFNEDSFPDIAVCNHRSNDVSILLNNRSGGFLPPVHYKVDQFPNGMSVSDLNQDGHLDIAVACINNEFGITILTGNGQGAFPITEHTAFGAVPSDVIARDFNCDGKIDLMLANGRLDFLEKVNGSFEVTHNILGPNHPYSIITADFNQDGRLDIAVPNSPYNSVAVLLNIANCNTTVPPQPDPDPDPNPNPDPVPTPDLPTEENALVIPNIFTPNGDAYNQVFHIQNLTKYPVNQLEIYNRWGKLVYTKKNYANNWNGGDLPAGVYYYALKLETTKQVFKGWITLVR